MLVQWVAASKRLGCRRPAPKEAMIMRYRRSHCWTLKTFALLVLDRVALFAQCSMCNAVASAQSTTAAHSLNRAILVLLIPPVVIMGTILIWAFKYRDTSVQI